MAIPATGSCAAPPVLAIRAGGDNDSEIGVLNALFQPQREANLRLRLDEYLRFGLHAGLFFAS